MAEEGPENTSPAEERRASIERLRAVGQTFADGIAAFRERVTTRPRPSEEIVEVAGLEAVAGSDDMFPSNVTSRDGSQRKELDRLNALLEASEARGDVAQEEADRLRAENESLSSAVDRSTRLLNNLRVEYDRLRAEVTEKEGQGSAAIGETVRLRSQLVEVERELQRVTSQAEQANRSFVDERKKSAALERVCMGLRRRVAIAEEKAQDSQRVQEALMAREVAEAQLAETKVDAERWRARSSAVEITRERAEAAERSERIQRDKVASLEKELESRESLLRQGMLERKKLKEYMENYERELEEKEMKLARLRTWVKGHVQNDRGAFQSRHDDDIELPMRAKDETDLGTNTSFSLEKDVAGDHDITSGDWDQDMTAKSNDSLNAPAGAPDETVTLTEASPLLREVEEAHAQLQAAVKEPDEEKASSSSADLVERVRRLEASFDALAHTRKISTT